MKVFANSGYWALILGGSSGIGLASAKRLAKAGMNIAIVHRDRRGQRAENEANFTEIKAMGVEIQTWNVNALLAEKREVVLTDLKKILGENGKIRVLLHSIARGNLKPLITEKAEATYDSDLTALNPEFVKAMQWLKQEENPSPRSLTEEDYRLTIEAMATSLLTWTQALIEQDLFAPDTRILGLTSEGNQRVWPAYGAVAAAKSTLESLMRTMAIELAPLGIKTNLIQAGVTDTPSLRMIPGSEKMKLAAMMRNPFGRLTKPEDVANVVYLLARDEAAWINGAIVPVDGGERLG
jgi:enoyl-[acyl-carrier protein] reductase III